MPVRTRYKVDVSVSSNHSEQRDLGNGRFEAVTDLFEMGGGWKTLLTAGVVQVQLRLDNQANTQFLVLRTNVRDPTLQNGPITVWLNSTSTTPFIIQPMGDCLDGMFMITTTGVTALYASNPGANDIEILIVSCGD